MSNVIQISSSIKEEFIQQLGDSKWLNDEFSKDAQNKLRSMTLSIDDPDLYLSKEAIEHYYKEVSYTLYVLLWFSYIGERIISQKWLST